MATFLFDDIVFGPIKSRRLGQSLGVNLLPEDAKVCNFNCVYCECGWTDIKGEKLPSFDAVITRLHDGFKDCMSKNVEVDVITFAGNGEPTMHPDFDRIIDETIKLRDLYLPKAEIAVLTNACFLHKEKIVNALLKIDMAILKLDSAFSNIVNKINLPARGFDFNRYLDGIKNFPGRKIVQTMFLNYENYGVLIDNTTDENINEYIRLLGEIEPELIMIYSVARDTPDPGVSAVSFEKLQAIAKRLREAGYNVDAS